MSDPVESVLRLVAEGKLSAAEAEPLLAALDDAGTAGEPGPAQAGSARSSAGPTGDRSTGTGRSIRLEVTEGGRVAVKVRLPASLGDLGLEGVPGLTRATVDRIRDALRAGTFGPVFELVDDDGDGVRIILD